MLNRSLFPPSESQVALDAAIREVVDSLDKETQGHRLEFATSSGSPNWGFHGRESAVVMLTSVCTDFAPTRGAGFPRTLDAVLCGGTTNQAAEALRTEYRAYSPRCPEHVVEANVRAFTLAMARNEPYPPFIKP